MPDHTDTIHVDDLEITPGEGLVRAGGHVLTLSVREFQLLVAMVQHAGDRRPGALAAVSNGRAVSYGQLQRWVTGFAGALAAHGLPQEAFEWYLDLRRYGSVPHAGFGMGIERCTAWMCGIEHVRETIPFPRMLYRLRP